MKLSKHGVSPVEKLKTIKEIAAGAEAPAAVVVVSKGFDADHILPLLEAGHRIFGESRVQEAESKWPSLKDQFEDVELHLVGPIQTNKVRRAVALFDCIETIDRLALAETLAQELKATGARLKCFVQVNTGDEPQKSGVSVQDADAFITQCTEELHLPIVGLMCIPPKHEDPSTHFQKLREIAERNNLSQLSMGMSNDYEKALQHGATHIRTAIFGS